MSRWELKKYAANKIDMLGGMVDEKSERLGQILDKATDKLD